MKLHECTFGRMVITDDKKVGHIVGVTYNIPIAHTGGLSYDELFSRTIPLVKFADGERGIHHANLKPFKG
jgi:hypothetical protein